MILSRHFDVINGGYMIYSEGHGPICFNFVESVVSWFYFFEKMKKLCAEILNFIANNIYISLRYFKWSNNHKIKAKSMKGV